MDAVIRSFASLVPRQKIERFTEYNEASRGLIDSFRRDGQDIILLIPEEALQRYKTFFFPLLRERTRVIMEMLAPSQLRSSEVYKRIFYADQTVLFLFLQSREEDSVVQQQCIDMYRNVFNPEWNDKDAVFDATVSALDYLTLLDESLFTRDVTNEIAQVLWYVTISGIQAPVASSLCAIFYVVTVMSDVRFVINPLPPLGIRNQVTQRLSVNTAPTLKSIASTDNDGGEQEYCGTVSTAQNIEPINKPTISGALWKALINSENVIVKLFLDPLYLDRLHAFESLTLEHIRVWRQDLQGVFYEARVYREMPLLFETPWFVRPRGFGRCPRQVITNQQVIEMAKQSLTFNDMQRSPWKIQMYQTLFNAYPNIVFDFLVMENFGNTELVTLLHDDSVDALDWDGIFIQIVHALMILEEFEMVHNDLHSGNIRVNPQTCSITYIGTDGVRRSLTTSYQIALFDWDRAYVRSLGNNPLLENDQYGKFGAVNSLSRLRDYFTIGFRLWRIRRLQPYLGRFARIYRRAYGNMDFQCNLRDLTQETQQSLIALAQRAKDQPFVIDVSDMPNEDRRVFTQMFEGECPKWFRGIITRGTIRSVLFEKASSGYIYFYPNIEMEDWPTMGQIFEEIIRRLPLSEVGEQLDGEQYEFAVSFNLGG